MVEKHSDEKWEFLQRNDKRWRMLQVSYQLWQSFSNEISSAEYRETLRYVPSVDLLILYSHSTYQPINQQTHQPTSQSVNQQAKQWIHEPVIQQVNQQVNQSTKKNHKSIRTQEATVYIFVSKTTATSVQHLALVISCFSPSLVTRWLHCNNYGVLAPLWTRANPLIFPSPLSFFPLLSCSPVPPPPFFRVYCCLSSHYTFHLYFSILVVFVLAVFSSILQLSLLLLLLLLLPSCLLSLPLYLCPSFHSIFLVIAFPYLCSAVSPFPFPSLPLVLAVPSLCLLSSLLRPNTVSFLDHYYFQVWIKMDRKSLEKKKSRENLWKYLTQHQFNIYFFLL